jgi:hypothetical protein
VTTLPPLRVTTRARSRRWRRCSSITASSCGLPRSAAGSLTPARTRTRPTRRGGGGRTGWSLIPRRRRRWHGSSPSGWPGTAGAVPGAGHRGRLHRDPGPGHPQRPASPAGRRYLLAGLLRCSTCERLLESCWSTGKPACRCRHGHTTATRPDPARPPNTYILPRLPALGILLGAPGPSSRKQGTAHSQVPAGTTAIVSHLRAKGITLTFDPDEHTLRVGTHGPSIRHHRPQNAGRKEIIRAQSAGRAPTAAEGRTG